MRCCAASGCAEFFGERTARRDARRYRRRGLDANARRALEYLRGLGLERQTVLEVGGGVGAIQLELLRAGAARTVNVELSPAYERSAADLARGAGLEGRVERRVFDFAVAPDEVEPADVVVMHKVVCCYPDFRALVLPAAERARRALVLTFPREGWWIRAAVALQNVVQRLLGRSLRAYAHPPAAILAAAEERGLRRAYEHRDRIWQVCVLARAA